eukprot:SAG31_NODE_2045_length_6576_cov_3.774587_3_plen_126_part_00
MDAEHERQMRKGLKRAHSLIAPLESKTMFEAFFADPVTPTEVDSKPHVLVLGQYSTGKTTFIEQLIGATYTGSNIGPEMTTDHFTAVLHTTEKIGRKVPGNATTVEYAGHFAIVQVSSSATCAAI